MQIDSENIPSFPEEEFREGLDPVQIAKDDELLERFGNDRSLYKNMKDLFVALDAGPAWKKTRYAIVDCLLRLRACGMDLFPHVRNFSTFVADEAAWYGIVAFLLQNREALVSGTYKHNGEPVSYGKVLGDKDVDTEGKMEACVAKVMPGVDIVAGTYPRLRKQLVNLVLRRNQIDERGIRLLSKGFVFMRDEFLPKLQEALQHFLSSRSEIVFREMVDIREALDDVLREGNVSVIPDYWVEDYRNFMSELNLMYSVYDKLADVIFRLGVIVEAGADIEHDIAQIHDKIGVASSISPSVRGNLRDYRDYMDDAGQLMEEMSEIITQAQI